MSPWTIPLWSFLGSLVLAWPVYWLGSRLGYDKGRREARETHQKIVRERFKWATSLPDRKVSE